MHEMQTIVTDVCGVCLSVCLSRGSNRRRRVQCTLRAVCAGSFGAAFAKCLWLLVTCSIAARRLGLYNEETYTSDWRNEETAVTTQKHIQTTIDGKPSMGMSSPVPTVYCCVCYREVEVIRGSKLPNDGGVTRRKGVLCGGLSGGP